MDPNKRFKSASGAPMAPPINPAANLAQYQPPPAILGGGAPSPAAARPSASISRGANGSSLKLKVRAPSSKLKQVTGAADGVIPPNPYADLSESDATPQPAARNPRQTRNPRTVVEPDSDEDMEDAEGDEQDEEDEMEEDEGEDEEEGNEHSEDDAEGEDDEEDELASDPHPPPPIIRQERPPGKTKPNVTVTAPPAGTLKSVEAKELEDDDDEELSELESNPDPEEEEEEEEEDSDEDPNNSRSATPDLSKLTKRQRGAIEDTETVGSLMELSNEAQKKKHLTAEEHAMRRAEMARRRKNLSDKRNEEEKMDTINKLLKKPAPKRRTRAEIIAQQQADMMATPGAEDGEEERADPLFTRWINTAKGSRVGVPDEWLEGPVGEIFTRESAGNGRLVQEVS